MPEPIHGHMPPAADIDTVLADPAGACPDCVRIVVEQLRDALHLAESDGDSARRDLTGAYKALIGVMPGSRPASTTAAAEKAAKMIRDHDAERRRVLAERDEALARADRAETERAEAVERLLTDLEQGRALYRREKKRADAAQAKLRKEGTS